MSVQELEEKIKSLNIDDKKKLLKKFIEKDLHPILDWCEKCGNILLPYNIKDELRNPECEWCKKTLCSKCSGFKCTNDFDELDGFLDNRFYEPNNKDKYGSDLVCLECEANDTGEDSE